MIHCIGPSKNMCYVREINFCHSDDGLNNTSNQDSYLKVGNTSGDVADFLRLICHFQSFFFLSKQRNKNGVYTFKNTKHNNPFYEEINWPDSVQHTVYCRSVKHVLAQLYFH